MKAEAAGCSMVEHVPPWNMALVSSTGVSTVFGSKKDSEKYAVQCTGCPVCFLVKTGNWALQADSLLSEPPGKTMEWAIPSPGDLPDPGIELGPPALQADSLPAELPEKPVSMRMLLNFPFKLSVKHIRDCRIHLSSRDL